jgi:hypothetical protein
MFRRLPEFESQGAVDALVVSLRNVIADTLDRSISFRCTKTLHTPEDYGNFGNLIRSINGTAKASVCSVITFNYDVLTGVWITRRPPSVRLRIG